MKPMRAKDLTKVKPNYPCVAQVKLDGVRAIVKEGVVYSRSLKPIPNLHIQKMFGHLNGFDGELMTSPDPEARVFNETTSAVMSTEGESEVWFHIYDDWRRGVIECLGDGGSTLNNAADPTYTEWHKITENTFKEESAYQFDSYFKNCVLHSYVFIESPNELRDFYDKNIKIGSEGIIIRNPFAPYCYGDTTKKDWQLIKMKPKDDAEFKVVGFEELMINTNEQQTNELGRSKRSSKKEGKVPGTRLGALILEYRGTTFKVGTGFTAHQRAVYWERRGSLLGSWAKVEYEGIAKNKPRFPSFKGFRTDIDLLEE